jgi:hypothetical protein
MKPFPRAYWFTQKKRGALYPSSLQTWDLNTGDRIRCSVPAAADAKCADRQRTKKGGGEDVGPTLLEKFARFCYNVRVHNCGRWTLVHIDVSVRHISLDSSQRYYSKDVATFLNPLTAGIGRIGPGHFRNCPYKKPVNLKI